MNEGHEARGMFCCRHGKEEKSKGNVVSATGKKDLKQTMHGSRDNVNKFTLYFK